MIQIAQRQAAWASAADSFAVKCAGCHVGGGNVQQPGATLFTEDLQRNGRATPEGLYEIIYKGKGKMPGFGKDCAPRGQCTFGPRFSDEEVQDMASYVLDRAAAGWKSEP
ncbi:Cytochrome c6 [Monoraphidium neglectum]|uniref:Cytochrome c-553 n=1 Tax=Monoraphidium neglectum TaxID=145388 RepID=A0A0D2MJ33_9CHLO|nr:Cytochrome c6 [Monoraphidium neglectum]KIZ03020.1 Cytochrome c6 [Monoraphidium neglectum]|eukprot:XP_013902039.1 Cytochrome c6 [Monoraphidium neglectum]